MSNILYHYCSVETFIKIIENKTLRFSDVMKSNDYKEVTYLYDKYYECMAKKAGNNDLPKSYLKYEIDNQLDKTVFLGLCFSKEPDSLHMWNCYADGGVAIGFDEKIMQKWMDTICYHIESPYPNATKSVEKKEIEYLTEDQIESMIEKICVESKFVTDGFGEIFAQAPFIKKDFFAQEKEVRMLIKLFLSNCVPCLDITNDRNEVQNTIPIQVSGNRRFVSVMSCDVPFPTDMIKSITMGPNCSLSARDVGQLFFANNINDCDINIIKSIGSYR